MALEAPLSGCKYALAARRLSVPSGVTIAGGGGVEGGVTADTAGGEMKAFCCWKKLLTPKKRVCTVMDAVSEVTLAPLDWGHRSLMSRERNETKMKQCN